MGAGLLLSREGASADYATGTNELPVQVALRDLLRPGDVFFDVGCNVGFFAMLAAREVGPTGSVHAFEAVPAIAAVASRNVALNALTNVRVHDVAVSDVNGTAELLLAAHPGGATLSVADTPHDLVGRTTVRVMTLDTMVREGIVSPPDVVKIDVEGAEEQVLRGMAEVLATNRPALLCELDGADRDVLGDKIVLWRQRMSRIDYLVEDLAPSYVDTGWHVYHGTAVPRSGPPPRRDGRDL